MGVWIETAGTPYYRTFKMSHPSWVCGLKPDTRNWRVLFQMSHPSWVCGLKLKRMKPSRVGLLRHTLRGCVDWNPNNRAIAGAIASHTLRGCVDWNQLSCTYHSYTPSHTLRGCVDWNIRFLCTYRFKDDVTPFVGVWIETMNTKTVISIRCQSHPSWVCGLKLNIFMMHAFYWRHTLRGCVDWNTEAQKKEVYRL